VFADRPGSGPRFPKVREHSFKQYYLTFLREFLIRIYIVSYKCFGETTFKIALIFIYLTKTCYCISTVTENTRILTNFTELSPSWEVSSCLSGHWILHLLWSPSVHYHFTPSHCIYLRFILIFPSRLRNIPSGLYLTRFPTEILCSFLTFSFFQKAVQIRGPE
jgi:hypothetical protein